MNDTPAPDHARLEVRTSRNPALEDMVARAWMTLAEGHARPRIKVVLADKEQQDEQHSAARDNGRRRPAGG